MLAETTMNAHESSNPRVQLDMVILLSEMLSGISDDVYEAFKGVGSITTTTHDLSDVLNCLRILAYRGRSNKH